MPMPGYYGQFPQHHVLKPGENGQLYPQYVSVPQPVQIQQPPGGPDGDQNGYPQQYYQAYVPFGPPPPVYPYMVPRHDGQVPSNYMVFPMYPKTVGGSGEMGHGQGSEDHDGIHDKSG